MGCQQTRFETKRDEFFGLVNIGSMVYGPEQVSTGTKGFVDTAGIP